MQTKSLVIDIKAPPESEDAGKGVFTGYASVFGNKDSYGDVILAGAFAESLKTYGEAGAGIPCYWAHDMSDPMKCIGWTVKATEDEHGLKVEVQLDLDNPNGAQAYKLIKAGVVNQMSFAYEVEDYAVAESEELGTYVELRKLKIFEVSVVQVGANQETELLDVKDRLAGVKAGRKLSAKTEGKLAEAVRLIGEVLDTKSDEAPDGSDQEQGDAKSEEPETANDEERTGAKSCTLSAAEIAEIELLQIGA